MENKHWLSNEDFSYIYGKVPRLTIDLVIHKDDGIVLVQRITPPYANCWHLPGGTVYKGETIQEASLRIAKNETGLNVEFIKFVDFLEFLNEDRSETSMHTISIIVEVNATGGNLTPDENAQDIRIIKNSKEVFPWVEEHLFILRRYTILE